MTVPSAKVGNGSLGVPPTRVATTFTPASVVLPLELWAATVTFRVDASSSTTSDTTLSAVTVTALDCVT